MSTRTSRREARERVMRTFSAALDRMIPPDESVPLRGGTFLDFENQVEEVARALLPTLLEERAALDGAAEVEHPGCCPHCGSARVYLRKATQQGELRSPHGMVVVPKQRARCRACGRSFSPSRT
jgi:hypothetical protein